MKTKLTNLALGVLLGTFLPSSIHAATADEARAIAKEAYIYGFPMVDNSSGNHFDSGRSNGCPASPPPLFVTV